MKIIGLTGGIGSGKSTVAQFLAEMGAIVVDLDKTGHDVLESDDEVREKLIKEFGKGILTDNGEINRENLAEIVFNDDGALQKLNGIVHPAIDRVINDKLDECQRQGVGAVVLEAAAMIEAGRAPLYDEIWVTTVPESTVLERLARRTGYSGEEAKKRIRAQIASEERVQRADVVIDTDCSLDELRERVAAKWKKFRERSGF